MTTYISLGGNCAVAYQLQQRGYTIRYPFDWCNISITQLNNVLEKNFTDFSIIKIHKLSPSHPNFNTLESSSYILKNSYNIKFAHEISNKYKIEDFQKKLFNRINKFHKIIKPTFIRLETKNISNSSFVFHYKKLLNNLSKYFEEFNLIIISKNTKFEIDPKYSVTFIKLEAFTEDWKFNTINWSKIIEK
ncbi:putative cysteine protease [Cafeteria roenbergensis virus]|uniref:Putative cysteine protease n=1 Tax=Cafeteria roenbergensis virus (strain BV-PW1) TaxID=693272 RepID=E3T5B4_CROVB|nr:putative cysteine protease [Cafeteria roenbergensis virus BV-PW1]ADO67377.1 putative cysteine protease [Cafeteria roenbergensis virus BV-PW1]